MKPDSKRSPLNLSELLAKKAEVRRARPTSDNLATSRALDRLSRMLDQGGPKQRAGGEPPTQRPANEGSPAPQDNARKTDDQSGGSVTNTRDAAQRETSESEPAPTEIPKLTDEPAEGGASRASVIHLRADTEEMIDAAVGAAALETQADKKQIPPQIEENDTAQVAERDEAAQAALERLQRDHAKQIREAVRKAKEEAAAELARALADQRRQHEEAIARIGVDADAVARELAYLQEQKAAGNPSSGRSTPSSEPAKPASTLDEGRALTEEEFARRQAADAERHGAALAKVREGAERLETKLAALQDEMAERLSAVRREAQATQTAKVAEVEARAEKTVTDLRSELEERIQHVRHESDVRHEAALAQAAAQEETNLARERAAIVKEYGAKLARAQTRIERLEGAQREVEAKLKTQVEEAEARAEKKFASALAAQRTAAQTEVSRALYAAEKHHAAEVRRIKADTEQTLADRLSEAAAAADRVRTEAVQAVRALAQADAQRRLEAETARVRAEASRILARELEQAQAAAAERRKRAVEKARAIGELEAAQALEDSLSRVSSGEIFQTDLTELFSESDIASSDPQSADEDLEDSDEA